MMLSQSDVDALSNYVSVGDTQGYYQYLQSKGDGYAGLALGVVDNDTLSGVVANSYAKEVAINFWATSVRHRGMRLGQTSPAG